MTTATPSEKILGPNSTMGEVLDVYPGARRALFRNYHIGGCSSCGFQMDETLAQLCERNGSLDVNAVLSQVHASHEADQKILISPADLAELRKSDPSLRLLDIRTREEWEAARIDGSILFTQDVMNEMLGRWPREALIVIYDHTGDKSMDAAAYFLGHAFQNVRALRGGIDAWSRDVDPSVRRYQLQS